MPKKEEEEDDECLAMDRYLVRGINSGSAFLGEGAFSMVWKATDLKTKKEVALKTYKADPSDQEESASIQTKFERQIDVLKFLQKPLEKGDVTDPKLWTDAFNVDDCFSLKLVDYSQDSKGKAAPYSDGQRYVVTEMAEYSLKDLIKSRREANKPLSDEEVQFIGTSVALNVAGLHAKKLVHLDFKAENIMMCEGKWRLIDLDGCVSIDHKLSLDDSTISFSPAYCSPEFAKFMLGEQDYLTIKPSMDVWSVGLTLCELVTLKVVINQANRKILGAKVLNSGSAIIEWLIFQCPAGELPLPSTIGQFSKEFLGILNKVLIREPEKRLTCAEMMNLPYFVSGIKLVGQVGSKDDVRPQRFKHIVKREANHRLSAVFKGILWKLNSDGDPTNPEHWLKRDFWIAQNGALCYFSSKQNKPLILIDAADLRCISCRLVDDVQNLARPNVFEIQLLKDGHQEAVWFSTETPDEVDKWLKTINKKNKTFNAKNMRAIRLKIRNKRGEIDEAAAEYNKAFESKLWKLDQEGDPQKDSCWRLRDMWLALNGSLCYYSEKQKKGLEYHCGADIKRSVVKEIDAKSSCKPYAFSIALPNKDDMEFDPSIFAAETKAAREEWIAKIAKLHVQEQSGGILKSRKSKLSN